MVQIKDLPVEILTQIIKGVGTPASPPFPATPPTNQIHEFTQLPPSTPAAWLLSARYCKRPSRLITDALCFTPMWVIRTTPIRRATHPSTRSC